MAGCFLFASCGDDDNGDGGISQVNPLLYGTWEEVDQESYLDGQLVPDTWGKWAKWTFKQNDSLIHFSPTYVDRGTYEYNHGDQPTLRLRYHGENYRVTILKLTETELVWQEPYPDDEYDYQILYLEKTTSEYDD